MPSRWTLGRSPLAMALSGAALLAGPSRADAQACFGAPSSGSVAYEHVRYSVGTGHGGSATFAPGRLAVSLAGQAETSPGNVSGFGAAGRFAVGINASRVHLCPGIGIQYRRRTWDPYTDVSVSSQQLAARAGLALGSEIDVYKGISIIPAAGVHYEFRVYKFDATGPEANEAAVTGDTASHVAIDYSLMARYRFVFLGARAERFSDSKGSRPYSARYVAGFAFGWRRDD